MGYDQRVEKFIHHLRRAPMFDNHYVCGLIVRSIRSRSLITLTGLRFVGKL